MMKKLFILLLVIFTFCSTNEKLNALSEIFSEFDKPNAPGAAVMVVVNGKPVVQKGFGITNLQTGEAIDKNTNFRLASVTKQFTAMCILILKEKGLLRLDDTLIEYFPDFKAPGKIVTIRNLLTHTSGLIDYENLMAQDYEGQIKDAGCLDLVMAQDTTYFEPGTEYRYSNSAYAILAMIIEKVSGKRYAEFLEENIFGPLKMDNSVAYEKGISTIANRAYGYKLEDGKFVDSDQSSTSAVLGDGGIYTSLDDYLKWDQALYTEKLVSRKTLEEAFTEQVKTDENNAGYGFGWFIGHAGGMKWVGHSGSTCGFKNYILRIPERRFTVLVLINRPDIDAQSYAYKTANLYLGKKIFKKSD